MAQTDEKGGGAVGSSQLRGGTLGAPDAVQPAEAAAAPTVPAATPRSTDPLRATMLAGGQEPAPAPESGLPTLGRFELHRKLGEGGMGAVYLATDPTLGRRVAIKVLRRDSGDDSEAARRRLLREAQGTAQLSHEHVIVVYEVGTHEGQVYLAMEYVAGKTLRAWQTDRGWYEILEMYLRAGRGLRAAHDAGLVHRDFKPDNVLVGDDGRLRVTDFGLVAAVDAATPQVSDGSMSLRSQLELAVSLTLTGLLMGTPRYMAPEQHLGQSVDARADQFAFCVALYEAWYRQPPFAGINYDVMVGHVLAGEVQPAPPRSEVPPRLHAVVLRGLRRQRDDRHLSMQDLLAALVEHGGARDAWAGRWRRWPWLAGALAVLVAATIVGSRYLGRDAGSPPVLSETRPPIVTAPGAITQPDSPPPPPAPSPPPAPAAATVEVTIDSSPRGAKVFLDGKEVGLTPYGGTLPRGDRAIRLVLRLAGYKAVTRSVTPSGSIDEHHQLKKQPPASGTINPF